MRSPDSRRVLLILLPGALALGIVACAAGANSGGGDQQTGIASLPTLGQSEGTLPRLTPSESTNTPLGGSDSTLSPLGGSESGSGLSSLPTVTAFESDEVDATSPSTTHPPPTHPPPTTSVPAVTTTTVHVEVLPGGTDALFETRSAILKSDALPSLESFLRDLQQRFPGVSLLIVGYTDSRGSERDNLKLSLDRAISVRDYFVSLGADPSKLSVEGRGESDPVRNDSPGGVFDPELGKQNRRVIVIPQV